MRLTKVLLLPAVTTMMLAACQNTTPQSDGVNDAPQTEQSLHERILTLDTHVDIPLDYMTAVDPGWQTEAQVDLPKMVEGGLDAMFLIVYTPQTEISGQGYKDAARIAETRYRAIQQLIIKYPDRVGLAYTAADVRKIVGEGRKAILIGMENAYPLGPDLNKLDLWARRGVRYVGITHMGHNQFGDSSNPKVQWDEPESLHGGLTPLGRQLVAKLNDLGVMVDVSHAAKSTMMEAVALSRVPVIASHSGAMSVATSARNLDDEQLRALANNGGVVQLVALDAYVKALTPEQEAYKLSVWEQMGFESDKQIFGMTPEQKADYEVKLAPMYDLAPPASVADFVDHIDHVVTVAGIDHVGIASDFDGGGGIAGWEDASKTPNVTAELQRRGYSEDDIAKIWGGNLLRVMEAVEDGRAGPKRR
ncbi:dipeptidase [Fretibacter rubidus]|uniref:dipeptidase n=1 Tax=Fretibacter rubidus TaxID=570162 RepID=UPI00352B02A0